MGTKTLALDLRMYSKPGPKPTSHGCRNRAKEQIHITSLP